MGRRHIIAVFILSIVASFFVNYNSPNNTAVAATPQPPRQLLTTKLCKQMHEEGTDINPPFCYAAIGLLELMAILDSAE
jgi:hypothetical protein